MSQYLPRTYQTSGSICNQQVFKLACLTARVYCDVVATQIKIKEMTSWEQQEHNITQCYVIAFMSLVRPCVCSHNTLTVSLLTSCFHVSRVGGWWPNQHHKKHKVRRITMVMVITRSRAIQSRPFYRVMSFYKKLCRYQWRKPCAIVYLIFFFLSIFLHFNNRNLESMRGDWDGPYKSSFDP